MAGGKADPTISPLRQLSSYTTAPCLYHKNGTKECQRGNSAYAARRDRVSFMINIGEISATRPQKKI